MIFALHWLFIRFNVRVSFSTGHIATRQLGSLKIHKVHLKFVKRRYNLQMSKKQTFYV